MGETTARSSATSKAQQVLDQSAVDGKFTFLVFFKDDSPATRNMIQVARDEVAKRSDQAVLTFVQVSQPAERALVERFEVARAPMPLTMAVAPNGAITGVFSKTLSGSNIDEAIVTPTMTNCMKLLQENKLVFVCVQTRNESVVPSAVDEMRSDPLFKNRVELVSMRLGDPAETRFLDQMQINPNQIKSAIAILLAPPGVLIGKYDMKASRNQVAADLHKAGKCCDDANCKHNQGATTHNTTTTGTRRK
jgi:hypothetical protein